METTYIDFYMYNQDWHTVALKTNRWVLIASPKFSFSSPSTGPHNKRSHYFSISRNLLPVESIYLAPCWPTRSDDCKGSPQHKMHYLLLCDSKKKINIKVLQEAEWEKKRNISRGVLEILSIAPTTTILLFYEVFPLESKIIRRTKITFDSICEAFNWKPLQRSIYAIFYLFK